MKRPRLILLALLVLMAAPAAAKEFRYYFGMQWVVTPEQSAVPRLLELGEGDTVAEAPMFTEDLFETRDGASANGKAIFGKRMQFATAVSSQSIRCSVARGDPDTLSATRRICLTDDDHDGVYDHYFDVGLGQGGMDVQFTGCIPAVRTAIDPVPMDPVDPATLRDPMKFRVKLVKIGGKKIRSKDGSVISIEKPYYEFGGSIGRNDRIWNRYSFCTSSSCYVGRGQVMGVAVEGIALRVVGQNGPKAQVEILRNLAKRNYWDMSRGNRPPPIYECPGTLFVKTDELTF